MTAVSIGRAVRAAGVSLLLAVSVIVCAHQAEAAQGLQKVADGIYAYADTRQASPANSFGANAGIVIGRDGILVVDTLISAKEGERFIRDIRAVSDKPIRYVVNTHAHLDHTFGNAAFARLGAVIVAHEATGSEMAEKGEATLKKAKAYGLTEEDLTGTTIVLPVITFSQRMEIDLGGMKVSLLYPGPSHTGGSILVHLPQQKVLFAGDALFTGYHPNLGDGDLEGWARVLDYMAGLDVVSIVPGHGPLSTRKDIAAMKDYMVLFDRKARELVATSQDPAFITAELKKVLPQRPELEFLIGASVQAKYLRK